MNTTYSNAIEVPQVDDINRLRALYGGTGTNASPLPPNDVIINFGVGAGLWVYKNNNAWAMISSSGAQHVIAADMNGNGSDEVVSDFGSGFGIQVYSSATNTWTPLHPVSSTAFTAGHIDSNGKADLIIDFGPGIGLWQYANNTTWKRLASFEPYFDGYGQCGRDVDPPNLLIICWPTSHIPIIILFPTVEYVFSNAMFYIKFR